VDIVPKYSKIAKNYLTEVIVGDIKYIQFYEDSFDGVVDIETIEHLHKKHAVDLILLMKMGTKSGYNCYT
jgi:hypothetical protein